MATILVIDDSPSGRAALAEPLRSAGHAVLEAGDGDAGVALAREHSPSVCLIDDVMPGSSGLRTIKALTEDPRTAGVKCIYMPRADDETERTWATNAGAVDCLIRPIDDDALLALVGRWASAGAATSSSSRLHVVEDDGAWQQLMAGTGTLYVGFLVKGPTWREGLAELSQLADEVGDRLVVAAVDADRVPGVAEELGLRGLPQYASIVRGPGGAAMAAPMTIRAMREIALERPDSA